MMPPALNTASAGLTQSEADSRARAVGPNEVAQEQQRGWFLSLLIIIRNPLVILLAASWGLGAPQQPAKKQLSQENKFPIS